MEINNGVTIYAKPGCRDCKRVKATFDKNNVPYTEKEITPEVVDFAHKQGHPRAPVVTVHTGSETPFTFGGYVQYGVDYAIEHFGGDE